MPNPSMVIRIAANLAELKSNLAEGKNQIETTTAAMQKLAASFSGDKLIQAAHNVSAAVEQIGGASKLSEVEMARVNSTLERALAKYQALGKEAPAHMVALAEATKQVNQPTSQMNDLFGSATKLLGAFGVSLTVGALVGFGKQVFDTASNIHDMALKLGISVEAVQGFKYAAEQSGSSLDAVGTAITKMNEHLTVGDASTVNALQMAGLKFSAIKAMKPEDAFLAIADAIKEIPDPMERSHLALALFGKGGAELLPGIKDGFREAADAASKMSKETIDSLERAQDAWSRLGTGVTIASGTVIAHSMNIFEQISKSSSDLALFAENVAKFGIGAAMAMANLSTSAKAASRDINLALPVDPLVEYKKHLSEVQTGVGALTREQVRLIIEGTRLHETVTQISSALGVNAQAVQTVVDAEKKHAEEAKKAAEIEARSIEQVTKLWDEYNTLRVEHGGTATEVQQAQIKQWADDLTARMKRAGTDTKEFYDGLAAVSKEKMESVRLDWGAYADMSRSHLQEVADRARALYEEMLLHSENFTRGAINHQRELVEAAESDAKGWSDPWETAMDTVGAKAAATAAKAAQVAEALEASIAKARSIGNSVQYDFSTPEGRAKVPDDIGEFLHEGYSLAQAAALDMAKKWGYIVNANDPLFRQKGPRVPGFADGVNNFGGGLAMVGERGPEMVRLPKGSDVIPNHQLGGGAPIIHITINGSVLSNKDEIARVVGDAIMSRLRATGMRMPVGA